MLATQPDLSQLLAFFKALSDESRLKIVGAVSSRERSVDELSDLLGLRAPTVSHHLTKLRELDLVSMRSEGTTHFYKLNIESMRKLSRQVLAIETVNSIAEVVDRDSFERKTLKDFLVGDKLKEIPASRKKRAVILRWLANDFEFGRKYTEKEVNTIIGRHHADFATLRRELVGANLLSRKNGQYWKF